MRHKLQALLFLPQAGPRQTTPFNGHSLTRSAKTYSSLCTGWATSADARHFRSAARKDVRTTDTMTTAKEELMTDIGTDPQGAHAATRGLSPC